MKLHLKKNGFLKSELIMIKKIAINHKVFDVGYMNMVKKFAKNSINGTKTSFL